MIEPTLGRIVWFTPGRGDFDIVPSNDGCCAAIVTYVSHNRLVNLAVFDAEGRPVPRTSVPLLQDEDPPPPLGYYCEWMPYQVQKARAGNPQSESAEPRPQGASGSFQSPR